MAGNSKGSRKIGRGNSKKWVNDGGPARSAKKHAKRHGCDNWRFHEKGGEHRTSTFKPEGSRAKLAAANHGCGDSSLHKRGPLGRRTEHTVEGALAAKRKNTPSIAPVEPAQA